MGLLRPWKGMWVLVQGQWGATYMGSCQPGWDGKILSKSPEELFFKTHLFARHSDSSGLE